MDINIRVGFDVNKEDGLHFISNRSSEVNTKLNIVAEYINDVSPETDFSVESRNALSQALDKNFIEDIIKNVQQVLDRNKEATSRLYKKYKKRWEER